MQPCDVQENSPTSLTADELAVLQRECSALAHNNWDGSVKVEQDQEGILKFELLNEEGKIETRATAVFAGNFMKGTTKIPIYAVVAGADPKEPKTGYLTLVPSAIVGFLGF